MAFNITDLEKLGEGGDSGPGVLDPFASLEITPKGKPGHKVQITITDVVFSTDAGKKPAGLMPSKGHDRKMHYVAIEYSAQLVGQDSLDAIEHPEDEPLPSRTGEEWLYLMPAETARAWTAEERECLADKVKRSEGFLAPIYQAASLPLQPFNGKATETVPASLAAMVKGRKGPLGKVVDGAWGEIKGMVFDAEITRREYQGKDYYDYKVIGLTAAEDVGAVIE